MTGELIILDETTIKDKMYFIRGQQVMLDSDLAEIYGYTTKAFNQQVKNNIEKIDEDFMFRLTDKETLELLRSKNLTLNKNNNLRGQHYKYNPHVFTEQGIYMLMTVLKGDMAIKQSKSLIRIFKKMKDYLSNNNLLNMVLKHDNEIIYINNEIKLLQETFDKLEEKKLKNKIFFEGQIYDSYSVLLDIFGNAKKEIIIIDNYAGKELLDILKKVEKKIIIISKNIDEILKKKYENQYNNITFINDKSFHDRFIILDKEIIYTCGMSLKDLGKKTYSINKIEEDIMKESLIGKIIKII